MSTANGEVLHTRDGGSTWHIQMNGLKNARSIHFINDTVGFVGSLDGRLFKTDNGGVKWTELTARLPKKIQGICGITSYGQQVHAVGRFFGGASDYLVSSDGGSSWQYTDLSGMTQGLVDVAFVNEATGFIGGMSRSTLPNNGSAIILRTQDGGASWHPVYQDTGGRGYAWKLWVINENVIYAALQSEDGVYRFAKTMNGGNSWETLIIDSNRSLGPGLQALAFVDEKHGWAGGLFRGMYHTADGGKTWSFVDSRDARINRFERVSGSLLTGSSRGVIRLSIPVSK
jgi:photosystem II stability/assembly factor-like uncharacterized protein